MPQRVRASVVCEADGQLLVVRLRDPVTGAEALYPPGGAIEASETPEDAARREALEETGIAVQVDPSLVVVDTYPFTWAGVAYDVTTHYFAAIPLTPPAARLPDVIDAEYNLGASWVPTDQALEAMLVNERIGTAVLEVLRRMRLAAWTKHANFDGPAAVLVAIHDQFRRVAGQLVAIDRPDVVERTFEPLARALHAHHHAEEAMLFPYATRHLGSAPARLSAEHGELSAAMRAVSVERTRDAIVRFERVLVRHLAREELLVMPALLAVPPAEAWRMLR